MKPTTAIVPALLLMTGLLTTGTVAAPGEGTQAIDWRWSTPPSMARPDLGLPPPAVLEVDDEVMLVVLSPSGSEFWSGGTVHLLDATSGRPIGTIRGVDGRHFGATGPLFVADADHDGTDDICVPDASGIVACVDTYGSFVGTAENPRAAASWPLHADLDRDGRAEVMTPRTDWPMKGWLGFVVKGSR